MAPVVGLVLLLASPPAAPPRSGSSAAVVGPAARSAAAAITPEAIAAHTKFLASDLLEGRGPATRGDALAREYVAAQFER